MRALGPGRGHFETMESGADGWQLSGWVCHPEVASTSVAIFVDEIEVERIQPGRRADVASTFPWIPHAIDSGFRFVVPSRDGERRVRVEAHDAGGPLTALGTTLHPRFSALPHPPPSLMQRVSGSPEPSFFDADGVRSFTEFGDCIAQYRNWDSISRMLDWGCGCGRVTRCFLLAHPELEVHGCDIDAEAVEWCAGNLPDGKFRAIGPHPPTGYPDGYFQLAIGYSVFSHFDPDRQREWLAEMRRIIAPGGLFLASVHGRFAARFSLRPSEVPSRWRWIRRQKPTLDVLASGFIDAGEDRALAGIAPAGYYRGTYQSPEWTNREWSKYFRVLEIREGGMQNYQDLVVLERR